MIQLFKKIDLPLDSSAYLRKAHHLFKEEKNQEALEFIQKAYETEKDIQINLFYTFMLSHFERYAEALEVANQEKEFYIHSEKNAVFYVGLLLKMQSFIEAEYIIREYQQSKMTNEQQEWTQLAEKLAELRQKADKAAKIRRVDIKKSLRELEQDSHMMQIKKIRDAEILDLSELQKVAPAILISPDISGTVQRYLLELLIQKGDQNVYSFMWFNQIKKVQPVELSKFDDIVTVREISKTIEQKLTKYPDLEARVKIEVMHDLLMLYPYIDEVVSDRVFWVESYINRLDFFNYTTSKSKIMSEEHQEMQKWINYLDTVAQRGEMFRN